MSKYSLTTNTYEGVLVRSSLPIRDICISPNEKWAAVASEFVITITPISSKMTIGANMRTASW